MAIRYYLLLFCMLFGIEADAQRFKRHEIDLSLGFGSSTGTQYEHFTSDMIRQYRLSAIWKDFRFNTITAFNAGYQYSLTDKWSVGIDLGKGGYSDVYNYPVTIDNPTDVREPLAHFSTDIYPTDVHQPLAHFSTDIYYALPVVRRHWYQKRNRYIGAYSQVAFGLVYQHNSFGPNSKDDDTYQDYHEYSCRPAYQFTFLGVEIGRRYRSHFYWELGYGCLGVFRFGLKIVR